MLRGRRLVWIVAAAAQLRLERVVWPELWLSVGAKQLYGQSPARQSEKNSEYGRRK